MDIPFNSEKLEETHKILALIAVDLLLDPAHLMEVNGIKYAEALQVAVEIIRLVSYEVKDKEIANDK